MGSWPPSVPPSGESCPHIYLFMSGRPQELPLPTLWLRLAEGTRPGLQ
jgi:hypothetical protein